MTNERALLANVRRRILPVSGVGDQGHGRTRDERPCIVCERRVDPEELQAIIRLQCGRIVYEEDSLFEHAVFSEGVRFRWAHAGCVYDSVPELEKNDWCTLCDNQFSQDVPGTAILVEKGGFESGKVVPWFAVEQTGVFHWACARQHWHQEMFNNLWRYSGSATKDRRHRLPSVPW
jgi:hypothetical protein